MKISKIKQFIVLMICVTLFSNSFISNAESDYKEDIIAVLCAIEPQKNVGLGDVKFSELEIGKQIHVYNYMNEGIIESRIAYPLFSEDKLIAIMYNTGESQYQLMSGLAEWINMVNCESLAIIYDRRGCHVYDGEKVTMIAATNLTDSEMGVLSNSQTEDYVGIEVTDLSIRSHLGYTSMVESRIQTTYILGVPIVLQEESNHCWAATTACLSNYLYGTSYTSTNIAEDYFGTNLNIRVGIDEIPFQSYLFNLFPDNLYMYKGRVPSDSELLSNMTNGTPIYGSFRTTDTLSYHAVVVYGYSLNGYIWVMDPEFGKIMAQKIYWSDTETSYSYVSSSSGKTLEFIRARCVIWD